MKSRPIGLIFRNEAFRDHEQVVFCSDRDAGLNAIIAIHDTTLGPGLGGTRVWPYPSEAAALRDCLRLSEGMTYKNALAGLALGGAKAVIIADPEDGKTHALLEAYGRHVERLGGSFITGEDVGTSVGDMDIVATRTAHVRGTSKSPIGDPSPFTAYGVLKGIEAALGHRLGRATLAGVRVSLQGLGHVGMALAGLLHQRGADLSVADIRDDVVARARDRFGARVVETEAAHAQEVDVFAPCALGAGLNARTIPEIRAEIVAGSANNQLETSADGRLLSSRGILYAPDYVINAGGVIAIAGDSPDTTPQSCRIEIDRIARTLGEIFARAEQDGEATSLVADRMAEERIAAARKSRFNGGSGAAD